MSVEGMWLLRTSQDGADQQMLAPGIIILESQRVFGGDSAYYHIGSYEMNGSEFRGSVRTRTHTLYDDTVNVFGMVGEVDYEVVFVGELRGDEIVGRMCPVGAVELSQDMRLTKLAELPG